MANAAFRKQALRFYKWRDYRMNRKPAKLSDWLEDRTEARTLEHITRFATNDKVIAGTRRKLWS